MFEIDEIKVTKNHEDYEVEGLLYCGNCNSPKECEVKLNGIIQKVACMCDCEAKAIADDEELRIKEQRIRRIKRLKALGFYDAGLQNWTFENDDRKDKRLSDIAKNYADKFEMMKEMSKGLLIYGESGSGKSYIVACIVNELINKGIPCMMTNFSRIANELWKTDDKQGVFDKLNDNDLLVIDDFTAERQSDYMNEIVFNVIDERYRCGLPLTVTTNLSTNYFARSGEITKDRITSRLAEMCVFVKASGTDRRTKKMKEDRAKLKEALGL